MLFRSGTLIRPAENVVVRARLVESGSTVEGTLPVQLMAGVGVDDLIRRNLERSIEIKEKVLARLDRALEMERAVLEMRRQRAPAEGEAVESPCAFGALCAAIRRQAHARRDLVRSIELLTSELVQILGPAPSAP